ncbi:hypothetical protein TorRG33x02_050080, partial [Trema orientale]
IGYNSISGQVTATDEVWDKLTRVHKKAKTFRRKGCPFYDKLCIIFGDTTATGSSAHPSIRSPSYSDDDDNEDVEVSKNTKKSHEINLDDDLESADNNSKKRSKSDAISNSQRGKRQSVTSALASALLSIS